MQNSKKNNGELRNHGGLSGEELALLLERTESMSQNKGMTDAPDLHIQEEYLVVSYLDERYGIPLEVISEVIGIDRIVALPGAPVHVMGLTRLRGQILSLVNLHVFWRGTVSGHNDCDYAAIINAENTTFGLLCHKAQGVRGVDEKSVELPPANLPTKARDTIHGIFDRDILLIDPAKLVAAPGFVVDL